MLSQRNYSTIVARLVFALAVLGLSTSGQAALINLTPTNGVNSSSSVSLADLVSGETEGLIVGDKRFTGFDYHPIGDMPTADLVNVLGFKDPDGNWGISFHGTFLDLPGDKNASDAVIRYQVQVDPAAAGRGIRISDAHLFLGGVGIGVGDNSSFTVDESYLGLNNSMSAYMTSFGQGGQKLFDSTFFDPAQQKLFVSKDILARAGEDSISLARATIIDQSFSQTPEPTAIVLAAMGLLTGCGFLRRRAVR